MVRVFHQNMLDFSGRSALRNNAFQMQLTTIGNLVGHDILVAGFTEVLSQSPALFNRIQILSAALDPGLVNQILVEVGTTAVGNRREWVAIAWDQASFAVEHAGLVYRDGLGRWVAANTPIATVVNHRLGLPAGLNPQADSRGLAYVGGVQGEARYLFGFMHNMYNLGDRAGTMQNIVAMWERARTAITALNPNYRDAPVVVGGDFNVLPPALVPGPVVPPRRNLRRRRADYVVAAVNPAGNAYVNTTNHHPYDYWLSTERYTNNDVEVHVQTRVAHASDHAGVSLNL